MDQEIAQICYSHRQNFLTGKECGCRYRVIADIEKRDGLLQVSIFFMDEDFVIVSEKSHCFDALNDAKRWIKEAFEVFDEQPQLEILVLKAELSLEEKEKFISQWVGGLFDGAGKDIQLKNE